MGPILDGYGVMGIF